MWTKRNRIHITHQLNFDDIEFSMTLKNIGKFERLNVLINIYGIEEQKVFPIRLTDDKKEKHVNLLYVQDPRDENVGHFAIKNLSRLVISQLSKHKNKKYFCNQ